LTARGLVREPAGIGVTRSVLESGPLHRLHTEGQLVVQLEGARLQSATWREVAAGANTLAVLHAAGEWELLQFLDAELIGPETYRLSRLLRGQAGTDGAMSAASPAGAAAVLMDAALIRADVASSERGAALIWRAWPPGAADPVYATEGSFTWRGLHARPWSPAHLRGRPMAGGGVEVTWIRRARVDGDGWEGEVSPGEADETYRVEVLLEGRPIRSWEVGTTTAAYSAEQIAEDFPDGPPEHVVVQVRQGSAAYGWGVPAVRAVRL
jgi:hypothetical protein